MEKCRTCGGADFFKEAGYYYCQTCQTQNEDLREEVLEIRVDSTVRLRKQKIKSLRSDKTNENLGWTTWELYNFVLIGLVDELIELGTTPDIKLTVLQLWTTYLGKIEVAFVSTRRKCVPRLARRYNNRDAEIIYGKVQAQKRARRRKRKRSIGSISVSSQHLSEGSTIRNLHRSKRLLINADYDRFMQSQASSEGDALSSFNQSLHSVQSSSGNSSINENKIKFNSYAKEEAKKVRNLSKKLPRNERIKYRQTHITTQYKTGPQTITPMRLWAILYLALRIHNEPIHLSDMIRYGREGHLSYYKLDHLIPPDIAITKSDIALLSQNMELSHKSMRRMIANMAKFLGVFNLVPPDFLTLISRYCQELELPRGIMIYTERLMAVSPPKMIFNRKMSSFPNYEGRAMAFIIVVLKMLFGIDGITEYQISKTAQKINSDVCVKSCWSEEINATPCIIVHGGAGDHSDSIVVEKMRACKIAASNGYKKLLSGRSSVEAVEAALWWLECDEFFNCGYGSVLNEIGEVEMDASMMDGLNFHCGSVAAVRDVEHPISLARYVMENLPNIIVTGDGAKKLATCANLTCVSKGNMVSPSAYLAFRLAREGRFIADYDVDSPQHADVLKGFGTVGCVAWDGYSIVAGTTTGGINRKYVGRVGDSAILGSGTYADKNVGCSLTGHGESIIKLGISRNIAEDVERNVCPQKSLKENFDYMLEKFEQTGGGVILKKDGCWASYCTSKRMPVADELGIIDDKLFSFEEWQRFIECRKAVLINAHFPTRFKYNSEHFGMNNVYIKFLESQQSKISEREEPEITSQKHVIPRELTNAIKLCFSNINDNGVPLKDADVFPSSVTPLYSYLRQLLEDPLSDLPAVLRTDFYSVNVGYIINPESIKELTKQCNINLEVIDSSLHFIEKIVQPFEQARINSVEELKEDVTIEDCTEMKSDELSIEQSHFEDYTFYKIPCEIKFNPTKETYYADVQKSTQPSKIETKSISYEIENDSEFAFDEILPNGRLSIPDSDSESDDDKMDEDENILLRKTFRKKYNLQFSKLEKESIENADDTKENISFPKRKIAKTLLRDAKGKFIKLKEEEKDHLTDEIPLIARSVSNKIQNKSRTLSENFDNTENLFSENSDIEEKQKDDQDYFNLSGISILEEEAEKKKLSSTSRSERTLETLKLFRPFKDYWMYHCIFSRVKPKLFESFQKTLPTSFRWLLNECANVIETSMDDLYEEVCQVEIYHAHIFKQYDSLIFGTDNSKSASIKSQRNVILSKW